MWWMYIGLGVVVASLVIFLFAMLAYSSTDMGESQAARTQAPLVPPAISPREPPPRRRRGG
jgi:hypothetical protein